MNAEEAVARLELSDHDFTFLKMGITAGYVPFTEGRTKYGLLEPM